MPSYTVTSPEGKSYTINTPKPATKEELYDYVQNHIPKKTELEKFGEGSGLGVSSVLGAPVDIVAADIRGVTNLGKDIVENTQSSKAKEILQKLGIGKSPSPALRRVLDQPIGGSDSIQALFNKLGIGAPPGSKPEGLSGEIGNIVGQTATSALLMGTPLKRVGSEAPVPGKPGTILNPNRGITKRITEDIARTAIEHPKTFLAGEVISSVGTGVGGYTAEEKFPDSPAAKAIGEVVGGITPAAIGTAALKAPALMPIARTGYKTAREFINSLGVKGAKKRARERISRALTTQPEFPKEGDVLEGLTAAQKVEQEGLLSLERDVMESTDALSLERQKQFADMNNKITQALTEEPGTPAHVRTYFRDLLDQRLRIAGTRADEMIAKLGPKASREDANVLAYNELQGALTAARKQESALYDTVDPNVQIPTESIVSNLQYHYDTLGAAQKADVPAFVKEYLKAPTNEAVQSQIYLPKHIQRDLPIAPKEEYKTTTTVRDARALQSRLRRVARNARKGDNPNFNKARIADELADSITNDLESSAEVSEPLRLATDFSRDLNQRFNQGAVGNLLRRGATGGQKVPSTLALETTVGKGGPAAREATNALLQAIEASGNQPELRGYITDYLKDTFRREAIREGVIDPGGANRFLKKYQDVLKLFPELGQEFNQAAQAGQAYKTAALQSDPDIAHAAVWLKSAPGKEIDKILTTSPNPREDFKALVTLASTDPTGRALQGLKSAYLNRLYAKSSLQSSDMNEQPFVSGMKMKSEILKDWEYLPNLFNRTELVRIRIILNTAIKMDKARTASPSKEGIIGDMPGRITTIAGRVLGAQLGRKVAHATGGGTVQTPGIFSKEVQTRLNEAVHDPAKKLLSDAMRDEQLFKAITTEIDTPLKAEKVRQQLNGWALHVLMEYGVEPPEEQKPITIEIRK